MANDVKELSLDGLFSKLHGLMVNLVRDIDSVLEDNMEISMDSVRELRSHITTKLNRNEEIEDNKKLLKLLNLFSEDRAVLEIIKEDSDEWVELLEAIEESINERGPNLTKSEQKEIKEINRLTSEIKSLIRKSD
jgi:transcriptional regulator of heat shock response